jgi:hypothetical protein
MVATRGRMATVGAATALLVGAGTGCASEYDGADLETSSPAGFEASPSYIGEVVDFTASDSYRYSMTFSFDMGGQSVDAELATGAFDGERSQMDMDLGAMLEEMGAGLGEEMPAELVDADLTMQQITDTDAVYIRAPFFTALTDAMGDASDVSLTPSGELFDVYEQLGDGWGRVDLDTFGDVLPAEAQQAMSGGQTTDPRVFLDLLRETADVEELGTDEIDGVEVQGLSAEVDLGDLMAASGTDPDALAEAAGGDELVDLESFTFPLEVWIDGEDRIRRIEFTFGADSFADLAAESGEDLGDMPSELAGFSVGMTMDFTDYGDGSIEVEVPEDAVDITDDFVAAYEDLAGG